MLQYIVFDLFFISLLITYYVVGGIRFKIYFFLISKKFKKKIKFEKLKINIKKYIAIKIAKHIGRQIDHIKYIIFFLYAILEFEEQYATMLIIMFNSGHYKSSKKEKKITLILLSALFLDWILFIWSILTYIITKKRSQYKSLAIVSSMFILISKNIAYVIFGFEENLLKCLLFTVFPLIIISRKKINLLQILSGNEKPLNKTTIKEDFINIKKKVLKNNIIISNKNIENKKVAF